MITDIYNNNNTMLLESFFENAFQTENPVLIAKADPSNILIASMENTYYVDMNDIETYMEAAEIDNVGEALNNIIEANDYVDARNICVMLDENTLGYSYDLDEIGCLYEAGMKVKDYVVPGNRLATKIMTSLMSKAAKLSGGQEASIQVYENQIKSLKDSIDRIDEEIKAANGPDAKTVKLKGAVKIAVKHAIDALPAAILASTGMFIARNKLSQLTGGVIAKGSTESIYSSSIKSAVGQGIYGGVDEGIVRDYAGMLEYYKKYYQKTIKELEAKKKKLEEKR